MLICHNIMKYGCEEILLTLKVPRMKMLSEHAFSDVCKNSYFEYKCKQCPRSYGMKMSKIERQKREKIFQVSPAAKELKFIFI
ncbi:hypothetical protein KUTeg_002021 [Tegillarca granosa]|uniref:Uncharacterized protein n=1 Tax=Tegillarca granosa TaxID=220873 RepID=A0ABQ9FT41_TEGGR|nr:hypothetical protein KUTeg_002021 [Tegillarca granosa]